MSLGSPTTIATNTASAISAKANKGPGSPTKGRTNKGASAGPTMVPSPKLDDSADKAVTRAERRVFEAR